MTGRQVTTGMARPLLDSHLHTFDLTRHPQPWIDPVTMAVLHRDVTVSDADLADRGVTGCVVVQTLNSTAETIDMLAAAESSDETVGVVGWVDLTGDVSAAIDRLRSAPGGHLLVGFRHLAHLESDPEWLLRPDVTAGLAAIAAAGMPYDLVLRPWQLRVATAVAHQHPDLWLVLDHLGNPPLGGTTPSGGDLAEWSRDLTELARRPRVCAKVSGLVTLLPWDRWAASDLQPVVDTALAVFGADRLMYGSDWPLSRLADGESRWPETYRESTASLTPAEQATVDHGTAQRIYRPLR